MTSLEDILSNLSNSFFAGQFREILPRFDLPVAIYFGDLSLICHDATELLFAMNQYRDALVASGIRRIDSNVAAIPMMRGQSGTIYVDKTYHDALGNVIDTSQSRYFVRRHGDQIRIRMIEYLKIPAAAETLSGRLMKAA